MNVQRLWTLGVGGKEPIQIDPYDVPGHDVNGIGEIFPQCTAGLMMRVSSSTSSEISDGSSRPFNESGSFDVFRWLPDGGIGYVAHGFIGLQAVGTVIAFLSDNPSTMPTLKGIGHGFSETAFMQ